MVGTIFVFGKRANGLDKLVKCIGVDEVDDEFRNSYTIDFDIELPMVELVIWLDKNYDSEKKGYRLENNLVDGVNYIDIENLKTFKKFTYMLEDYLKSIEPDIKQNFFK